MGGLSREGSRGRNAVLGSKQAEEEGRTLKSQVIDNNNMDEANSKEKARRGRSRKRVMEEEGREGRKKSSHGHQTDCEWEWIIWETARSCRFVLSSIIRSFIVAHEAQSDRQTDMQVGGGKEGKEGNQALSSSHSGPKRSVPREGMYCTVLHLQRYFVLLCNRHINHKYRSLKLLRSPIQPSSSDDEHYGTDRIILFCTSGFQERRGHCQRLNSPIGCQLIIDHGWSILLRPLRNDRICLGGQTDIQGSLLFSVHLLDGSRDWPMAHSGWNKGTYHIFLSPFSLSPSRR